MILINTLKINFALLFVPLFCFSHLVHYKNNVNTLGYNNFHMLSNGELIIQKEFIKSAMVIFDVGANVGEWTESALKIADPSKIYLFEPIPDLYDHLKTKFRNNNVLINNLCLSNYCGTSNFNYYSSSALSTLYARPEIEKILNLKNNIITVQTRTLDNFCKENSIENIDFLKIDTEGAEYDIMMNSDMIKETRIKVIQFEYGGTYIDAKKNLKDIYNFLTSNYHVFRIFERGLIYIPHWSNELENYKYSNYLAVSKDYAVSLGVNL